MAQQLEIGNKIVIQGTFYDVVGTTGESVLMSCNGVKYLMQEWKELEQIAGRKVSIE